MKSTDPPIILEYIFNTATNKVWNALTRIEEMVQWYFGNIKDFQPEVGYKTKFEVYSGLGLLYREKSQ